MPATHLISVDLPAPLSPTSAIVSPARTSKSTSCNASTEPKCLETPRSSRRGVSSLTGGGCCTTEGAPGSRRPLLRTDAQLAVLRVLPRADLALLQEPVREEELVVRLRDPHRRQQDRLRPAHLGVGLDGLLLDDRDRRVGGRLRLELHGLVD